MAQKEKCMASDDLLEMWDVRFHEHDVHKNSKWNEQPYIDSDSIASCLFKNQTQILEDCKWICEKLKNKHKYVCHCNLSCCH
jgi:hypothetical protein